MDLASARGRYDNLVEPDGEARAFWGRLKAVQDLHRGRLNGAKAILDDDIGGPCRAADYRGKVNNIEHRRAFSYSEKTDGFARHL